MKFTRAISSHGVRGQLHGGGFMLPRAFLFGSLKIMFQAVHYSLNHIAKQSGLYAVALVKKGGTDSLPSPSRPSLVQVNDFTHLRSFVSFGPEKSNVNKIGFANVQKEFAVFKND